MMSIFQCTNAIFNWSPQIAFRGKFFFETLLILHMLSEVDYILLFALYLIFSKNQIVFILALFIIIIIPLCTHIYVFQKVRESELGDAVVVDVDENTIKTCFNDLEELPSEIVSLNAL